MEDGRGLAIAVLIGLGLWALTKAKSAKAAPSEEKKQEAPSEEKKQEASENPALAESPPWTSNPTPGEIELQRELAIATVSGQNLTPTLQSAFGPAWDLMVVTPEQYESIPDTLKQYYTTDGLARVRQMREYWMANHPGEAVPEILTDEYYYKTLKNASQIGIPIPDVEPAVPTAQQQSSATEPPQVEQPAAQQVAAPYSWVSYTPFYNPYDPTAFMGGVQQSSATYNPAYDPNLAFMGGVMFNF